MGLKVVKFGGSSLADAEQFKKVAAIVKSDPNRRFVVASAPGKRFSADVKVTDMLYHCYEMVRNREDITEYFNQISERYNSIIEELGLNFNISGELDYIRNAIQHHAGRDFAASRGEYLNSMILAKYLGFDFIDAESVVFFRENGLYDDEKTNREMRLELEKHEYAVIFTALCQTVPSKPSAAAARILQDLSWHVPQRPISTRTGPTFRVV